MTSQQDAEQPKEVELVAYARFNNTNNNTNTMGDTNTLDMMKFPLKLPGSSKQVTAKSRSLCLWLAIPLAFIAGLSIARGPPVGDPTDSCKVAPVANSTSTSNSSSPSLPDRPTEESVEYCQYLSESFAASPWPTSNFSSQDQPFEVSLRAYLVSTVYKQKFYLPLAIKSAEIIYLMDPTQHTDYIIKLRLACQIELGIKKYTDGTFLGQFNWLQVPNSLFPTSRQNTVLLRSCSLHPGDPDIKLKCVDNDHIDVRMASPSGDNSTIIMFKGPLDKDWITSARLDV